MRPKTRIRVNRNKYCSRFCQKNKGCRYCPSRSQAKDLKYKFEKACKAKEEKKRKEAEVAAEKERKEKWAKQLGWRP